MTDRKHGLDPEHGLIIIDNTFASKMVEPIDPKYLTSKPMDDTQAKCWIDGLVPLAKHGFSVRIPEMVAFEAARMIHDGTTTSAVFQRKGKDKAIRKVKENARLWLSRIVDRKFDDADIKIEPPDASAQSPAAAFIDAIHRQINDLDSAINKHNRNKRLEDFGRFLQETDTKNFGDMAALDIIMSLPRDWTKPVFYFTDDDGAFAEVKKARGDLQICQVNNTGYLETLKQNNLLPLLEVDLGIVSTLEIDRQISAAVDAKYIKIQSTAATQSKNLSRDTTRLVDRTNPRGENDFPFQQAVGTVKDAIIAAHEAEQKDAPPALEESDEQKVRDLLDAQKRNRLAKFERKPNSPRSK